MGRYNRHTSLGTKYRGHHSGIVFEKLSEELGAQVHNVDLGRDVSEIVAKDILDACVVHGVLVFRDQILSKIQQIRFTKMFGPVVSHVVDEYNADSSPELSILSNIRDDKGKLIGANRSGMQWHSDGSFRKTPPNASLLYGVKCPPIGASTEFCSTYAAYSNLDTKLKKYLSSKNGIHDYSYYWSNFQGDRDPLEEKILIEYPPIAHPALRTHPVTKWNTTYLMVCMTERLQYVPLNRGRALIAEVTNFASQQAFVYIHEWSVGDLLFWDNRCTMHRATNYDDQYERLMHRTSVAGDVPYFTGLC